MATRRRPREAVGEPLFGEDWWQQDQQLFHDSLTRRSAPRARPRRPARPSDQTDTLQSQYTQDALFSDDLLPSQGAEHEPLRRDGPEALGTVAARPVRPDRRSGQLLLEPWDADGGADRPTGAGTGRGRLARRGIPGQGRPTGPGASSGGGDRADRDDPAGAGTRRRPGSGVSGGSADGAPRLPDQLAAF